MNPKVLLFADDIRAPSGVGRVCSEIVLRTAHQFRWVQIAVLNEHPDEGKRLPLRWGESRIVSYPCSGFNQPQLLQYVLRYEKPDVLILMQDPARWRWLTDILVRSPLPLPIIYYTVWDNLPDPFFNLRLLRQFQTIACISKVTFGIAKRLLKEDKDINVVYVPHGVDSGTFYPMNESEMRVSEGVNKLFGDARLKVFVNAVHQTRKRIADIVMAFYTFLRTHQGASARLVIHAKAGESEVANLDLLVDSLEMEHKIVLHRGVVANKTLNLFYNHADLTVNIASEEGFGLATVESLMAGTSIAVNVTGGLQDQCGFALKDGRGLGPSFYEAEETVSDPCWKAKISHGPWVRPMWPAVKTLVGGAGAPLLFQELVDYRDLAQVFLEFYQMPPQERERCGKEGREFAMRNFSSTRMVQQFNDVILEAHKVFSKRMSK